MAEMQMAEMIEGAHPLPKIRSWAPDEYETGARLQAEQTSRASGVHAVAIMPDAHQGLGACIGTVVATKGTILPAAVGVDLGCGMTAAKLNITAENLPDDLRLVLSAIAGAVPARTHDDLSVRSPARSRALKWLRKNQDPTGKADMGRAAAQIGTLGSGNHFAELSKDDEENLWLVLHSGSRGVGNWLARQHIKVAKSLDRASEMKDLAVLHAGTAEFAAYISVMRWAQDYAYQNREAAVGAALEALRTVVDVPIAVSDIVRCHHNYAELEHHEGVDMWVTRKGAIRAQAGDRGIIPGSMGTATYIVDGLGNPDSFYSAAHGAGRVMSRRQAKERIDVEDFVTSMDGRVWQSDQKMALLDEAPSAYKDIEAIMERQSDLCIPVLRLEALVNYKGT